MHAHATRWTASLGALILALCTVIAVGEAAFAGPEDDRARAEVLIQEGLTLARAKQFRAAIPKFEEALKLYPHPETRHNLGRAHEELGELRQAFEYFSLALKDDYQFAADGRQRLMAIEAKLRESYARVTVRTTPSQATVVLRFPSGEEETHVSTPFQTWVPAGRTTLVGSHPAFKSADRTLDLVAGEDRDVSVVLIPLPKQGFLQVSVNMPGATVALSGRTAGKSPLAGLPWDVGAYELEVKLKGYRTHREQIVINPDEVTSVNVALLPTDENGGGEGVPEWVGWTLIGTGAVAGGIALYLQFGKAHPAQDEADKVPRGTDEAEYQRLHQKAIDFQTAAIVTGLLGAALVGTGTYLLIAESGDGSDESAQGGIRLYPDLAVTPDGGMVGGTIRF